MILPLHPSFCVQYLPDHLLLRHCWCPGTEGRLIRQAHEMLLQLLSKQHFACWLADISNLPEPSTDDYLWALRHLMPRLLQLPILRLAIVTGPAPVQSWLLDMTSLPAHQPLPYDLQLFADAPTALHWLTDGAPLAAAVQEWEEATYAAQALLAVGRLA